MILPGHVGAGYLAAHFAKVDERVAVVAALLPDLIDKSGRYLLHITPNARVPMHSALTFVLLTLLVAVVIRQRRVVLAWALGYGSHLVADLVTDLVQGNGSEFLFWPLLPATVPRFESALESIAAYSLSAAAVELGVTLLALFVFLRQLRRGRYAMPAFLRNHFTSSS